MKIQEYDLKRLGQPMVDFHDDLRDLISFGKYAHPIVNAIPAWTADNGEMAFYDGGTSGTLPGKRIYVRLSSSWEVFATAGNGVPAPPEGAIQFNSSNFFGGNAAFIYDLSSRLVNIRHDSSGVYQAVFIANTQSFSGGASGTSGAIRIGFGFANEQSNAAIVVGRVDGYANNNQRNSYITLWVESGGKLERGIVVAGDALNRPRLGVGITDDDPAANLVVNGNAVIGGAGAPAGLGANDTAILGRLFLSGALPRSEEHTS